MPLSGFQVERLLERLRALRRRAMGDGPARTPHDPVRVSPQAQAQAAGTARPSVPAAPGGAGLPPEVTERRAWDPVRTYELERRAGSFMMPPYAPLAPPARIPRLPHGGAKGRKAAAEREEPAEPDDGAAHGKD